MFIYTCKAFSPTPVKKDSGKPCKIYDSRWDSSVKGRRLPSNKWRKEGRSEKKKIFESFEYVAIKNERAFRETKNEHRRVQGSRPFQI